MNGKLKSGVWGLTSHPFRCGGKILHFIQDDENEETHRVTQGNKGRNHRISG